MPEVNTSALESAVSAAEAGKDSVTAFIQNLQTLNSTAVAEAIAKTMAEGAATAETVAAGVQTAIDGVTSRVTGISAGLAAAIVAPPSDTPNPGFRRSGR